MEITNEQFHTVLEYDKVKAMLAEHTRSTLGRELVDRLEPLTNPVAVEAALRETNEAAAILERGSAVPFWGVTDVRELVGRLEKGSVLGPADLARLAGFLRGCAELRRYMRTKREAAPTLSLYAEGLADLGQVAGAIEVAVEGARVADAASSRLRILRRDMEILAARIQAKLQSYLNSPQHREALQESFVSTKDGHHVLPVKTSHRHRIDGTVIAVSSSGSTVFIEPAAVGRLVQEMQSLRAEEEAEEYQVLASLSGLAATEVAAMSANLRIMAAYDFAFAKGGLGLAMGGIRPGSSSRTSCGLRIVQGRHPLLGRQAVPLDLEMGGDDRQVLVVTGPNTGGKTVVLKTVGLFALMAQSGLLLPAAEGTVLPVFDRILADIGDAQNLENSLSTFSSHMGRISAILDQVGYDPEGARRSLVLLDEIGTGTDPAEGAALAMAVLEELHHQGATVVATTHYGDVKRLAGMHRGFINGRMDFDPETLRPLYRLVLGEAGASHALWIADRLGLGRHILDRAREHLAARGVAEEELRKAEGTDGPDGAGVATEAAAKATTEATTGAPFEAATTEGADKAPGAPVSAGAVEPTSTRPWQVGDSVLIQTLGQTGRVFQVPDAMGEMVVFTRGKRVRVNHKRVKLLVAAEHLYPADYDMKVALYTWHDRKLMHQMEKRHVEGARRVAEEGKAAEGKDGGDHVR